MTGAAILPGGDSDGMNEKELIAALLAVFPNMTLGEDNDGQLLVYTDVRLVGGLVQPFEGGLS